MALNSLQSKTTLSTLSYRDIDKE